MLELQFGPFVCSSLKRRSSCSLFEVLLPHSNSTILSGSTGRYTMKLTIFCLSLWRHLKHQGCVHWLGHYPQSLFHQLIMETRERFSFPSIWVISSSTSVHSIAPPPVFFRVAYLALVADDKPSNSFQVVPWFLVGTRGLHRGYYMAARGSERVRDTFSTRR